VRGVGGRERDSRGGRNELLLGNLRGGRLLLSETDADETGTEKKRGKRQRVSKI
jgi:hypothetical protein